MAFLYISYIVQNSACFTLAQKEPYFINEWVEFIPEKLLKTLRIVYSI